MANESKSGPDWRPLEWEEKYVPLWRKIDDVYDFLCTESLKGRYLKQAIGEEDTSFQVRVELSTADSSLKKAVESNAGLLNKFELLEDSPDSLKEASTAVTLGNDNLKTYEGRVSNSAFKYGCVLLGCHLAPKEFGDNREPYFSCIKITDVYAPLIKRRFNQETGKYSNTLTRISIRSFDEEEVEDGFSVRQVEVFRVYRLGEDGRVTVAKYQRLEDGKDPEMVGKETEVTTASGKPLGRLPFEWLSFDPHAQVGQPCVPPFLGLTESVIRLFNMESELDAIQRKVNIPMPKQGWPGGVPESPPNITLGPDRVWHYDAGADVGFAEPAGTGMAISNQRIQELKAYIDREQEKFVGVNQNTTATAALLDSGQVQATMQWFSNAVESSFEELFKLWRLFSDRSYDGVKPSGGIKISLSFLKPPVSSEELSVIPLMIEAGGLKDAHEVRAKLKELGWRSQDWIDDADQMRENSDEEDATPPLLQTNEANGNAPLILG